MSSKRMPLNADGGTIACKYVSTVYNSYKCYIPVAVTDSNLAWVFVHFSMVFLKTDSAVAASSCPFNSLL